MYGEMPTGGGFGSFTEYEIGAANMAEAAHCILGSLAKLNSSTPFWIEKEHIREEMGIIERSIKEYSKDLYIGRVFKGEHAKKTIESVKLKAPKLEKAAMSARRRISKDLPKEIQELAKYAYDFLVLLARKLLDSVNAIENGNMINAYSNVVLKSAVKNLRRKADIFLKLPDDGTIDTPTPPPREKSKLITLPSEEYQKELAKAKKAKERRKKIEKMDLMDKLFKKDI